MQSPADHRNPLLPVGSAADPAATELATLLDEPFASAWAACDVRGAEAVRQRLGERVRSARRAEAALFTVRRRRSPRLALAEGVHLQTLYAAATPQALRPGEPLRATLIELAPGASFDAASDAAGRSLAAEDLHREWLLVSGSARQGGETLSTRDYRVMPPGHPASKWISDDGALLFLRESRLAASAGEPPFTVRDTDAGWQDYGPGIQRRVLWQCAGEAAMLYYAQPGAQVPQHRHGHDEECLMLQGELFLDDLLLQAGDYQLAPAGSGHRITETDTGAVIYAHGDLALDFVA